MNSNFGSFKYEKDNKLKISRIFLLNANSLQITKGTFLWRGKQILNFKISLYPRERSSGDIKESLCMSVRLSVCLSVCLSVQIRVRSIPFFLFDIGLPYLTHGCITIRRCVAYIHYPGTNLNFGLKVEFIGFLTCFCVRLITFL